VIVRTDWRRHGGASASGLDAVGISDAEGAAIASYINLNSIQR
jgi:hypothetical protein